jgi:hypothetical protein
MISTNLDLIAPKYSIMNEKVLHYSVDRLRPLGQKKLQQNPNFYIKVLEHPKSLFRWAPLHRWALRADGSAGQILRVAQTELCGFS